MYFQPFGGSALIHLLAAHPKIVALFGVTLTVGLLSAPHGPGRYVGTETHLARLEAATRSQEPVAARRTAEAERAASRLLELGSQTAIAEAVEYTLRRCGPGCTDLSTGRVTRDPVLLRRVLVLYALDLKALGSQNADAAEDEDSVSGQVKR